jgi:hypothetical protein
LFSLGKNIFIYATLVQFIEGIWFLYSQDKIILLHIISGKAMFLIIFTILASLYIIYLFSKKGSILLINIFTIFILIMMVLLRRLIELYYLEPYSKDFKFISHYQFSPFLMFLLLFIIMLILFAYLFKCIKKNRI